MFILPVNRDCPPTKEATFTYVLIGLNSLVWLGLTVGGMNQQAIRQFGLYSTHWTLQSVFAHMFLHAGFWHVAGNMWFLWMFAPKLEERFGGPLFALAYLVCGLGAAGLQTVLTPGSSLPMVGASGAVSGVAGMYFVLFPRSPFDLQVYLGWWKVKSFNALTRGAVGVWIGEQFVLAVLTSVTHGIGIAFWAHVGGFVTGFLIGAAVVSTAKGEEREAILRPKPYTDEERDEIFADREEQPSHLTSLNLNSEPKPSQSVMTRAVSHLPSVIAPEDFGQ